MSFTKIVGGIFCLWVCLGCSSDTEPPKRVIGAVLSLSGPAGEQGHNIRKGIELAVSEHAKEFKVLFEDDGTNPSRAAASATKLFTVDRAEAMVGGVWDYLAYSIYPIAVREKKLFITPTNPIEIIPVEILQSRFIVTIAPTLISEKESIRVFLKAKRAKTVMAIYPNVPFGESKKDILEAVASEENISVVKAFQFPEEGNRGDAVKIAATKLAQANPDVALVVLDYDGLAIFANEIERLGNESSLLTTQHLEKAIEFSKRPQLFTRMYGLQPKVFDRSFIEKFKERFGENPKVFAAHGYDAAKLLMTTEDFQGATGDCKHGVAQGCAGETEIVQVRDGVLVPFNP